MFKLSCKKQLFLFGYLRPRRNLILKRVKGIFNFVFNNNFNALTIGALGFPGKPSQLGR
jgi:hypothetical protein